MSEEESAKKLSEVVLKALLLPPLSADAIYEVIDCQIEAFNKEANPHRYIATMERQYDKVVVTLHPANDTEMTLENIGE